MCYSVLTWLQIWISPGTESEGCHVLASLWESRCCPKYRRADNRKLWASWGRSHWWLTELTLSFFALYGALLSVMEVCVRLNIPDNSCQNTNRRVNLEHTSPHQQSIQGETTWRQTDATFWFHQLTRLNRRVLPESHSPTRSTALRTVLLDRKYFTNTEERGSKGRFNKHVSDADVRR